MIDLHKAKGIAEKHLVETPLDHPDYRWKLVEPVEHEGGWYFECEFECLVDLPPESWESFGGSPGFVVYRSDGHVEVVGWP